MIMNKKLPCLIFTSDCILCDEQDALARIRNIFDMSQLKHAFFSSLGGNLRAFRRFCENDSDTDSYRIYKLNRMGEFGFAFCEKSTIGGALVTVVFLAEDQSEFYGFLSPESRYFKNLYDRFAYELLYIKDNNIHSVTSVSPDTFMVLSRVPHLVESLFGKNDSTEHCNVIDFTKSAVEKLSFAQQLRSNEICFSEKHFDDVPHSIVRLPSVPFAFLLYMAVSVSSALSDNHKITVSASSLGKSSEIEISTSSHRFSEDVPLCDISVLEDIIPSVTNFAKIIPIISNIADIDSKFSFTQDGNVLSLVFGINYESSPTPDFKFSDPTEHITAAFEEASRILSE